MVKHDQDYNYVRPNKLKRFSDRIAPIVIFFGSLAFYITSMAPSIYWGGSSAYVLTNNSLGINDGTGFPLYTIIGRIFSLIPSFTPVFNANLMSAFFGALSVMFFYMIIRHFLDIPAINPEKYKKILEKRKMLADNPELREEHKDELDLSPKLYENMIPNLVVTVLYAVILPVWFSAAHANIFPLQIALTLAAFYFVLIGAGNDEHQKYYYLGVWVYLLSFGNHPLMALAFAPAFVFLIFYNGFKPGYGWGTYVTAVLFVIIAFSTYLYIPFRAPLDSTYNWYQSTQNSSFWMGLDHVRRSFTYAGLVSAGEYFGRFKEIILFSSGQIGLPLAILWFAGVWGFIKVVGKKSIFFVLAILGNILAVIWLGDFSQIKYNSVGFLAPMLALILTICIAGVIYLLRLKSLSRNISIIYSVMIVAFLYVTIDKNIAKADMSRLIGPNIFCAEIIKEATDNSIVIVNDDIYRPMVYSVQSGLTAKNITIISAPSLSVSEYRYQIMSDYPNLIYPTDFKSAKNKSLKKLIRQFCTLNSSRNNIYVEQTVPGIGYEQIEPAGVLFKWVGHNSKPVYDWNIDEYRLGIMEKILKNNPAEVATVNFASRHIFNLGDYYNHYGRTKTANRLYEKSLDINSGSVNLRLQYVARLARAKKYKDALKYISEVLDIDSQNPVALQMGQKIVKELEDQNTMAVGN